MRILKSSFIALVLSEYYSALELDQIPDEVIAKARTSLVDFIGVLVLGYRKGMLSPLVNDYLIKRQGAEESTWFSIGVKTNAADAAMSMGVAAHAVELDDGYRFGTAHPAVVVIPAALAICERENKSFGELLKSIIIGYDAMLRIARSINPSHWQRGFHSTSTCGVIGSAFACASLLNMNSTQMAHTISIAALQSAGLQEMLHNNPSIKPFQVGKATANGVMAADLAALGAKGPNSIFEGEHGWISAVTDDFRKEDLFVNMGSEFEIMNTYTKLYPTCRHCHAAIELAIEAQAELALTVESIDSILVRTYDIAIAEVGKLYYPHSYDDAMFSLPFSVALALRHGRVSLCDYHKGNYNDQELHDIQNKIIIEPDKHMNQQYPKERGSFMSIKLKTGTVWEKQVDLPKGEPERPLSKGELQNKVLQCITPFYKAKVARDIWKTCVEDDIRKASYGYLVKLFESDL